MLYISILLGLASVVIWYWFFYRHQQENIDNSAAPLISTEKEIIPQVKISNKGISFNAPLVNKPEKLEPIKEVDSQEDQKELDTNEKSDFKIQKADNKEIIKQEKTDIQGKDTDTCQTTTVGPNVILAERDTNDKADFKIQKADNKEVIEQEKTDIQEKDTDTCQTTIVDPNVILAQHTNEIKAAFLNCGRISSTEEIKDIMGSEGFSDYEIINNLADLHKFQLENSFFQYLYVDANPKNYEAVKEFVKKHGPIVARETQWMIKSDNDEFFTNKPRFVDDLIVTKYGITIKSAYPNGKPNEEKVYLIMNPAALNSLYTKSISLHFIFSVRLIDFGMTSQNIVDFIVHESNPLPNHDRILFDFRYPFDRATPDIMEEFPEIWEIAKLLQQRFMTLDHPNKLYKEIGIRTIEYFHFKTISAVEGYKKIDPSSPVLEKVISLFEYKKDPFGFQAYEAVREDGWKLIALNDWKDESKKEFKLFFYLIPKSFEEKIVDNVAKSDIAQV